MHTWKLDIWLHLFLTLVPDGFKWLNLRPGRFLVPLKKKACTFQIGGCVGPRVGMEFLEKG